MKKKIKFLGLISAFAFIVVSAISMKSFATEENPAERYDTDACIVHYADGGWALGSRCITPKALGPCTRISDCISSN
ncbi:hypothetical protein WG904_16090 [Pedobacter sp. Du54]|uniref:hypothetical protein n=1 Tax=Pedobacter anseongensis TaxID=3133439 RepID=UPI0030A4DFC2